MPEGQVDSLMQEVADQHGLELGSELSIPSGSVSVGTSSAANREQDELSERLAKLRGN
ncbi:hypothetical protein PTSG_11933 [Salpingoeca rosetta]|uniref:Uncharacterized protein n=1 Tax=Salpingoeca rosetta (strain ATCC 50818 / BSB-021) TaxID=946362 RepID=F2U3I6_SALR5|nr:uncharacterized protein PTSG_11933 [Salpingoeca rosetta]EGD82180.1 hypothetical protein PTSG_11933 [Salpingoeca rosetta]|eukprot:XP_004996363.1 hypothetical protein PTSG_11933 [Salpingoeca rosetta]